MQELNTKHSRKVIFYGSALIVALAGIGVVTAYNMNDDLAGPKEVVGDPSKRIGKGDAKSENPVVIDSIDKPADQKTP
ncbi:MAG: hypothetical protein ABW006_14335 [Hyphomicrobium sp.]